MGMCTSMCMHVYVCLFVRTEGASSTQSHRHGEYGPMARTDLRTKSTSASCAYSLSSARVCPMARATWRQTALKVAWLRGPTAGHTHTHTHKHTDLLNVVRRGEADH